MGTLEFQTVLFNFHDVILLMTAMQCLFCFLLLSATAFRNNISILFFALFLFAHALIPINELMMWGADFKFIAREKVPSLYFIPAIAYYVDGALLFLCFKSLVNSLKFKLKNKLIRLSILSGLLFSDVNNFVKIIHVQ